MKNAAILTLIGQAITIEPVSPIHLGGVSLKVVVEGLIGYTQAKARSPIDNIYTKIKAALPPNAPAPADEVYFLLTDLATSNTYVLGDSWINNFIASGQQQVTFTLTVNSTEEVQALATILASSGFNPTINYLKN